MSGSIQTANIPLYVFPNGGGYKIGINASLHNGATYRMYEFDTGGTGFWAAYNPVWWINQPGTDAITTSITYTSSITFNASEVIEPVTFETTSTTTPTLTVGNVNVAAITFAEKPNGGNSFTNQEWQNDISATPVVAPLYDNFFGDFGMGLGTGAGLFAVLPQFSGTLSALSNGFIIDLGQYPTNTKGLNGGNYVQTGSVQVGLTAADILSFPYQIAMLSGTLNPAYPNSGQTTYAEVLANGSLTIINGGSTLATPTGIVFDTGAPSATIHSGTVISQGTLGPFINGGRSAAISSRARVCRCRRQARTFRPVPVSYRPIGC